MDKFKLVKKYEDKLKDVQLKFGANFKTKVYEELIEDLKILVEPQKVVIPPFVVDWITYCKDSRYTLKYALYFSKESNNEEVYEWVNESLNNQETFALAWINGYEIKKEKKYSVKLKGIHPESEYLYYGIGSGTWRFRFKNESGHFRKSHTRKELEEAGFGEIFDSSLFEVEEVEE